MLLLREQNARSEAVTANRAKDIFIAKLSHELRTPLSPILMWTQLIQQDRVDFERAKKGARIIEQSVRTQCRLIDDLLDISRITSGKLSIEMQVMEPVVCIKTVLESLYRGSCHSKEFNLDSHTRSKSSAQI